MIAANELSVVIGLGKSGYSCARYLAQQNIPLAVMDSRKNPPYLEALRQHFPHIPVFLGGFNTSVLAGAQQLIVSPGVSLHEPALAACIAKGIPAIGDIELFARAVAAPIVAITGTNGKSTVTTLVGEMAQAAGVNVKVGGNLGTPVLDLLQQSPADLYVLEISSFQLETTYSLKAAAAVVLNISPDHMDRYVDLADYLAVKQKIYHHCQVPVINYDDPLSYQAVKFSAKPISFGLGQPPSDGFGLMNKQGDTYLAFGDKALLKTSALALQGTHQLANILAALALGYGINLPMDAMLQAAKSFTGLSHRCQKIAQIRGVDWYNDSKATNVSSTLAAIKGLGVQITGKLILLAGGQGKGQDFLPLQLPIKDYARAVILLGEDASQIEKVLATETNVIHVKSLEQAVAKAKALAQSGDVVLLSPACASFDMFKNFEDRGEQFVTLIKNMT